MEQLGFDLTPQRQVFTVSELTAVMRELLEDTFRDVWVSGEISNAKLAPSGHYYFTLKDGAAQIRCVCFRLNARYLKVKPQDGLAVMARGRVSVYEARGEYQLYVEHLEPQGYGALQLAFEQLKKILAAEGLFDDERKRPLPVFPRRIGIVTSIKGAAIADMLRILQRRFDGLRVLIFPVRVQGEGAAGEIARAVEYFSRSQCVDVVIVGRGGGSLEDLWAFNEEQVARAIAGCDVPVISAVGHQTDFTIADFVADLRAPTPSAAAELVVKQKNDFLAAVDGLRARLGQAMRYKLATSGRQFLQSSLDRATALVRRKIGTRWQRIDEIDSALRQNAAVRLRRAGVRLAGAQRALAGLDLRVRLAQYRARLDRASAAFETLLSLRLERGLARLDSLDRHLRHLSPLAILERGYAIIHAGNGQIIRSSTQAAVGDPLAIRLHRGRLAARVEQTESES